GGRGAAEAGVWGGGVGAGIPARAGGGGPGRGGRSGGGEAGQGGENPGGAGKGGGGGPPPMARGSGRYDAGGTASAAWAAHDAAAPRPGPSSGGCPGAAADRGCWT